MFNNVGLRLIIGVPLAAAIAYGLFVMMNELIDQEFIQPEPVKERIFERITPKKEAQNVRTRDRNAVQKLHAADKPPPPPKVSATKFDIELPTPVIRGAAPSVLNIGRLESLVIEPVTVSDRDAQPIRPPVPTYPIRAAEREIEGICDVAFDVDPRGRPYNVEATCTNEIFKTEAERAVKRVEFAPKIVRGQPAERHNVVYPIEFKIDS